jgi:hypothetical protein
MALTQRERCQKRLVGLKQNRTAYEAEAREIASYGQPARSRWLNSDTNKNTRQRNSRLNSSHGIFAFRTLQGGMTSGLSSPSRPWKSLTIYDEALKDDPEVKAYLAEVDRRMDAFLAEINFYGAVKTGYLELGMFGTEACIMWEHPTKGAVCHQLTFGEYWIARGAALDVDTLYRRCPMTANEIMGHVSAGLFRKDRLRPAIINAYDSSSYDQVFDFFHAIEPNDDMEPGYADWRGKPFRSIYWDEADGRNQDDGCVSIYGCEEQPFWAPRWDTAGGDAWGTGPGHDALPDLRELQLQAKRKGETIDNVVWPEIIAPARVKLKRQPRSVVSASTADMAKVEVPYTTPYQAIELIAQDVERCERSIDRATFADLFMAITDMGGENYKNIEEITSRNEEKLTQLGPVIERVNNEKLNIAIDRTFGIMERARLLPPAPDALRASGGHIKTEFVSILTQMQRMVGLGQIERTAGFIGNMVATSPDALDNLDVDETVREYASRAGAPPQMIRSEKDIAAIRDSRAQAQKMQQMVAAAPAAKDGATAAKVMSEIDAGSLPIGGAAPL